MSSTKTFWVSILAALVLLGAFFMVGHAIDEGWLPDNARIIQIEQEFEVAPPTNLRDPCLILVPEGVDTIKDLHLSRFSQAVWIGDNPPNLQEIDWGEVQEDWEAKNPVLRGKGGRVETGERLQVPNCITLRASETRVYKGELRIPRTSYAEVILGGLGLMVAGFAVGILFARNRF